MELHFYLYALVSWMTSNLYYTTIIVEKIEWQGWGGGEVRLLPVLAHNIWSQRPLPSVYEYLLLNCNVLHIYYT